MLVGWQRAAQLMEVLHSSAAETVVSDDLSVIDPQAMHDFAKDFEAMATIAANRPGAAHNPMPLPCR